MAKEEWGTKRICPETGKRFYDLNNSPVISPYTGKELILDKSSSQQTKLTRKSEENISDVTWLQSCFLESIFEEAASRSKKISATGVYKQILTFDLDQVSINV